MKLHRQTVEPPEEVAADNEVSQPTEALIEVI